MSNATPTGWRPGKKDAVFFGIVLLVIVLLVLGTSERTTKATPNDAVHQQALNHETCLQCHGEGGVRPQPPGHSKSMQCFQCHTQPQDWQGVSK